MPQDIDPQHSDTRDFLRVLGPLVAGVGLIFTIIGIGSFFSSFGSFGPGNFGPPRYFWCLFIGMPLLAVGGSICKFAFMGAVTRYIADEVAPVGKDVVNYMVDGTKDSIRDVTVAVSEGISEGVQTHVHPGTAEAILCPKCSHVNDGEAQFCKNCGAPLSKTRPCPNCSELNDADARFCDHCGKPLA
jgi:RNA polymerase subunit RPABC4/transcription elongation factor Spt4